MASDGRSFRGRIISVDFEDVVLPDGHRITLEIVQHPGGAGVVAVDESARVCLLRQYRHVTRGWLWEIPAGKLEPGEPLATARAELAQEAGLTASRWDTLGAVHPSPGIFTEVVHLYLARDLGRTAQQLEAGELLEVHWVSLASAAGAALSGEISDAKTAVALLRAAARLDCDIAVPAPGESLLDTAPASTG
jgi:8-oxo-dGTP pyrophosphatase MutT (NUDIX family)